MSEAPAELWVRPRSIRNGEGPVLPWWYQTLARKEPDAVRYVRADLYEAAIERLRIAEFQEPAGTDCTR